MTDRRRVLPLIVLAALVLLLAGTTLYFGRDEYQQLTRERGETIGTQTTLDEKVGPGRLRIGEDIRKSSGIETAKLHGAESGGATQLQGVVLDIRPLVDARGRYRTQSAEIRALRASAAALEQEYRRARELFADDRNVSERAVAQAETEWKTAKERLAAAEAALRASMEGLAAEWGRVVAEMALNVEGRMFGRLLEQQDVLLLVTLPPEVGAADPPKRVVVEAAGGGKPRQADLVGPSPNVQAGLTGATFYYRTSAGELRAGARVTGQTVTQAVRGTGVVVPESAVVWFAGRSWVYARDEKEQDIFERVPADATRLVPGGWFNASGLEPGTEVVVVGAQLLLSEELEYQIRNENED
ncbi:MAG: hypothetical protein JNL33_11730 [Betaproteobacteria bacterium]|nr:hypothetical protein [Betaproteobacteria bacterium]